VKCLTCLVVDVQRNKYESGEAACSASFHQRKLINVNLLSVGVTLLKISHSRVCHWLKYACARLATVFDAEIVLRKVYHGLPR